MAPKAKSTSVYVIVVDHEVHSAFATLEAANAYIEERDPQEIEVTIQTLTLEGGSITLDAPPKPAKPAKPTKVVAAADGGAVAEPVKPKMATPAPAVENDTASSSSAKPNAKGKSKDDNLPENVKELLNGEGGALNGQSVVVTGTFPKLGRKNLVKLVENYGGDLKPELRKSTNLVVIGDDLGSKKQEEIAKWNLKTVDEDGFIDILEQGRGIKRGAAPENAGDTEEEEQPAKASKKQKK